MYGLNINVTTRQLAQLGVTLPAEAARVVDVLAASQAAVFEQAGSDFTHRLQSGDLTADNVGDELRHAATVAAAAEQVAHLHGVLEHAAARVYRDALRDDAERIISDMRAPFEAAADTLHTAGDLFAPGADAAAILAAGPNAAAAWQQLGAASATLTLIRQVRCTLADAGYGQPGQDVAWWVQTLRDADDADQARQVFAAAVGDPWHQLTAAGYRLRLNTATEAQAVAHAAATTTAAAQRDAELARIAAFKRDSAEAALLAANRRA